MQRPNKAGYTPAMLASLAHVQNEEHRDAISRLFAASNINAQAEQVGVGLVGCVVVLVGCGLRTLMVFCSVSVSVSPSLSPSLSLSLSPSLSLSLPLSLSPSLSLFLSLSLPLSLSPFLFPSLSLSLSLSPPLSPPPSLSLSPPPLSLPVCICCMHTFSLCP